MKGVFFIITVGSILMDALAVTTFPNLCAFAVGCNEFVTTWIAKQSRISLEFSFAEIVCPVLRDKVTDGSPFLGKGSSSALNSILFAFKALKAMARELFPKPLGATSILGRLGCILWLTTKCSIPFMLLISIFVITIFLFVISYSVVVLYFVSWDPLWQLLLGF